MPSKETSNSAKADNRILSEDVLSIQNDDTVEDSRENDRNKKNSLLVSSSSNIVAYGVEAAIGFLLTPFIIAHVGKNDYGIMSLALSMIGYYGLLNMGVRQAVWRFVSLYSGKGDTKAVNRTLSTAFAMFLAVGLTGLAISLVFDKAIASCFNIDELETEKFRHVLWLFGGLFAISLPGSLFHVTLISRERFVMVNTISAIQSIIRAAVILVVLSRGGDIVSLATVNLAVEAAGITIRAIVTRICYPAISLRPGMISKSTMNKLLGFGISTVLVMLSDQLRGGLDTFVIGSYTTLAAVTVYVIGRKLQDLICQVVIRGSSVLVPRFSIMEGANANEEQKHELLIRSLRITATITWTFLLDACLLGRSIIHAWVGDGYEDSFIVLILLVFGCGFDFAQQPAMQYMIAHNKHKHAVPVRLVDGVLNLGFSLVLVRYYGMIGVAMGTTVAAILTQTVYWPICFCRISGVNLTAYMKALYYPLTTALPLAAIGYFSGLSSAVIARHWLIPVLPLTGILSITILSSISFPKEERSRLLKRFLTLIPTRRPD